MNAVSSQVMDLIFGRWRSQILSAGTELGVFDHLENRRAKTAETLAAELGAAPSLLYRLLRAQAAIGLLEEDGSRAEYVRLLERAGWMPSGSHYPTNRQMGGRHGRLWMSFRAAEDERHENRWELPLRSRDLRSRR